MPTLFSVAELQGLYGPFFLAERVVQKIWLRQDFATTELRTVDGRRVEILSPGRWNLIGGPDFHGAQLRLGGRDVSGDVEVHFHAGDWTAHGHISNPAYDNVVLHVLLFPPTPGARVQRRSDGSEIPALVLLPWLHRDLEEYSADDALESITARDEWRRFEELASLPLEEVRGNLRALAFGRWERKVGYARTRLARLGWEAALHHAALEGLGYRQNRTPMLAVAERWPLAAWRGGVEVDDLLRSVSGWRESGLRPANRPRARLTQYQAWVNAAPAWPEQVAVLGELLVGPKRLGRPVVSLESTGLVRRHAGFPDWYARFDDVARGRVSSPRLDTLVCDGFLPLLAARGGGDDLFGIWFHWYPGDLPDQIRQGLMRLGVTGTAEQPLCHGFAQGLLAWLIEREFCA